MLNQETYENTARNLSENPGTWQPWPETFPDRTKADACFRKLRDGEVESFRVDSAAFRWRVDEFRTIVDEAGRIHMETCYAW